MQELPTRRLAVGTLVAALLLLAWDASGLDMPLARWWGGPGGFPLHDHWFLTNVLHDAVRRLAWIAVLLLCVGVWFPLGMLRRLKFPGRLQLAVTTLSALSVVNLLKAGSPTSCPWSLAQFGGVAQYLPHWGSPFEHDGGSGSCFPAGHAASAFAFLGGYFAFRRSATARAWRWLAASLVAGLALGVSQQMRGAHFMSHTLWSGWVCWCIAWAVDAAVHRIGFQEVSADLGETP